MTTPKKASESVGAVLATLRADFESGLDRCGTAWVIARLEEIEAALSRQSDPVSAPTLSDTKEGAAERVASRLNTEANFSEELDPSDSSIGVMREAASLLTSLKAQLDEARKDRDRVQAIAFRLADQVETLEDKARKRRSWLDKAKEQRGYHVNVSFDTVWAETCAKADRAETAEAELSRVKEERDNLDRRATEYALQCNNQALRIASSEARLADCLKALEPFANAHNRRPFINDTHSDYDREFADEQAGLTWGDLRRAALVSSGKVEG